LLDGLAQDQVRVVLRQLQAAVAGDGNVSATTVGDAGPVSFQLTSMKGTDGGFGVIVERPRPNQLAELIMRALQLTDRERTITGWVAAGRTTGQVAAALGISPHTVNDHLKAIYRKANVGTRNELTALLYSAYYLPPRQTGTAPSPYGYFLTNGEP
jgi:DNA-binding CsgD family transcriptional regulator